MMPAASWVLQVALRYAMDNSFAGQKRLVLFFDMGGGGTTVSVVEFSTVDTRDDRRKTVDQVNHHSFSRSSLNRVGFCALQRLTWVVSGASTGSCVQRDAGRTSFRQYFERG